MGKMMSMALNQKIHKYTYTHMCMHVKFQQRMWRIGAHHGESYARMMLICVCVFFIIIIINIHNNNTMIIFFVFVYLFVSFLRCCFSLICSQWESLMELWLDWIWIWFRFLDSVFVFRAHFTNSQNFANYLHT